LIPELEDVLRGYDFYACRRKLPDASGPDVRAALKLSLTLSRGRPDDEPAAILYAFAIVRQAFPGAWRAMALRLAKNQAAMTGKILLADDDTLALIAGVRSGDRSYEQVCLWMALRLKSVY
jgi:hypothetical protein